LRAQLRELTPNPKHLARKRSLREEGEEETVRGRSAQGRRDFAGEQKKSTAANRLAA